MEQTVKQIGYPRWDKMLASKKKDNTKAGRNSSADSTYIYNIPFVRENENYVNASLNLKITGADTTFGYSCDWQYQNKVHGSPNVDSTAERHAVYFMILDFIVFGDTSFIMKDESLFANSNPISGRVKAKIHKNQAAGKSQVLLGDIICVDVVDCGTPSICKSNCDYLNCPWDVCRLLYVSCWCTSACSGDEGEGGGGFYEGEGSGAGGNGGSGNSGGGTPPNCTPGHHRSAQYPPCDPGWESLGLEEEYTESWFNQKPNYTIDSSGLDSYPCVKSIITKIIGQNNSPVKTIHDIFSHSTKFNIKFEVEPGLGILGKTSSTPAYYKINSAYGDLAYLNITITLSQEHLLNSTKLSIAETIVHELIHAYFFYRSIDANGDSAKEQLLANELGFLKPYNPSAPIPTYGNQHEQMASNFVDNIVLILKEYKLISATDLTEIRNTYPSIDVDTYYKAMVWGGLSGDVNGYITKAWETFETNHPDEAIKYKIINSAEVNATPLSATKEICQ